MENFLQLTVGGLAVGGIYAVAALGFVIIFKSTRVINFAQGAMMALGGYVGFAAITLLSLPLPIAIAVSAVVTAAVVGLIYVSTIAPVAARGNSTEFAQVIITMGWSIVLLSLIELMFGPLVKSMPRIFPTGTFSVGTIRIPYQDVGTISVAAVIITVFAVIFTWTRFGLVLRGLSDNRQAAVALGANAVRVGFGAWALGGAAAALAAHTDQLRSAQPHVRRDRTSCVPSRGAGRNRLHSRGALRRCRHRAGPAIREWVRRYWVRNRRGLHGDADCPARTSQWIARLKEVVRL